ncbi:hypothetical protein O181_092585 [Austropuccinia psidii MF-1]|uniref:Uncharacterized protein n=1 Tax=Austropuccinia psidii MF-1 TaxID=1389203 RepID=A0A9Q3IYV8_9BASI|nr:hypothetical protein [Austropuccinia psidii MF-1]
MKPPNNMIELVLEKAERRKINEQNITKKYNPGTETTKAIKKKGNVVLLSGAHTAQLCLASLISVHGSSLGRVRFSARVKDYVIKVFLTAESPPAHPASSDVKLAIVHHLFYSAFAILLSDGFLSAIVKLSMTLIASSSPENRQKVGNLLHLSKSNHLEISPLQIEKASREEDSSSLVVYNHVAFDHRNDP